MKENYQLELENLLASIPKGQMPSLLLHSCCGPCSTYVLEYLSAFFDITVYFYNPNIMPLDEYRKRLQTQKEVLEKMTFPHSIKLVEAEYDVENYLSAVKGLENEPEHGKRCEICMDLRIEKTANYASKHGYNFFCTTLSVSPHKNAELLHSLSEKYSEKYGIAFLPADFKKKNGYLRSTQLSKELDIYRQNYCGCIFSKNKTVI